MKHIILFLLFILSYCIAEAQTVIRVKDGDTYVILLNGKLLTIRLENIDAPELGQLYGQQAKDSVNKLLYGQTVSVSIHGTDIYGRTLATITYKGQRLDSILVSKGWAWVYPKYSSYEQLYIYQYKAREIGIGLWL